MDKKKEEESKNEKKKEKEKVDKVPPYPGYFLTTNATKTLRFVQWHYLLMVF